jgi:regulator of CtrA degradation
MGGKTPAEQAAGAPILFGRRLAHSDTFKELFREGMSLVEETANYLDGDGRADSRDLPRGGSLGYATESMRLTTRLMQIASWLLLQRAVNDGEISIEQAMQEKTKVRLRGFGTVTEGAGWEGLPQRLRQLIERSVRLQERVIHLDDALYGEGAETPAENPVSHALGRLARAFGGGD